MKTAKTIILTALKKSELAYLASKVKSVKKDSYTRLRIKTENMFNKERDLFNAFLEQFRDGHFDGMYDIYEYKKEGVNSECSFKYVFVENKFTPEFEEKAKAHLLTYGVSDDETSRKVFGRWYQQMVWTKLSEMEA